jgi:hypothetical protein
MGYLFEIETIWLEIVQRDEGLGVWWDRGLGFRVCWKR